MSAALERELKTYKAELPALMAQEGKFVLIFEDKVLGTFEAYSDAIQAGYKAAGVKPFLVKKITGDETIAYFSREFAPVCQQ
jgi:hypothetical protein